MFEIAKLQNVLLIVDAEFEWYISRTRLRIHSTDSFSRLETMSFVLGFAGIVIVGRLYRCCVMWHKTYIVPY